MSTSLFKPWPPLDFVDVFDSIHGYEGVVPGGALTAGHWMDTRPNDLETGLHLPVLLSSGAYDGDGMVEDDMDYS
jgi:hypothetical protein